LRLKKVIFFILFIISTGVYSQNQSHDSIHFSCPQWIEAESTILPVSLVFYRDGNIDPLVNQSFTIAATGADIDLYSIRIRNGAGTLSLAVSTLNSFEINLPELGISRQIELRKDLPILDLAGTLNTFHKLTRDTVYRISGDLLIPEGKILQADPGSLILIDESCNILVSGNIHLLGSTEQAIVIKSVNKSSFWGGIELTNVNDTCQFMNCFFVQGGNDPNKVFGHSDSQAVVMAVNSKLNIRNSYFFDNPGKALGSKESYINISNSIISRCDTGGEFVNSVVTITNTSVLEIPDSDGIIEDDDNDGFYFSGVHTSGENSLIAGCIFSTGEDDGIDHNGAKLRVEDCRIENFHHEGIACSNSNWVEIFSTLIINCDQGIEAGYGSPNVFVDHCVILNCRTGYRFGDNYDWGCSGKLTITNSIAHNNLDNFLNFDIRSGAPVENAIDVTFTITNDPQYDTNLGCMSAVPEFDELFFLQSGSPGSGRGNDQTNLGLYQEKMQTEGIREYYITCDMAEFLIINQNYQEDIYIPVTITYRGITLDQARMRIRGDGTRVHPKKSLKVKLDNGSFPDGRTVLNFNAEYEDKSYLQQYIVSRLMRESGLPCFGAEHVRIYLNGEYRGLYLLIENMDQDFLIRRSIDPMGNLYKATNDGASLSIYDNVYYHWEKKTGSGGRQDLQELITQINSIDQDQYQSFAQSTLAYDNMINILALNLLTRNYSTYYHNYYMYHDVNNSNMWYMFPWDLDKTFLYYYENQIYHHSSKFWAPDNPYLERAILDENILKDIQNRIGELYSTRLNDEYLAPIIDSLHDILKNSVADDHVDNIESVTEWESFVLKSYSKFDIRYIKLENQFENLAHSFSVKRMKRRFDPGESILFSWNSTSAPNGELISYVLFVGKEMDLENGSAVIIQNLTDTSYYFSDGLTEGKYFWKVVALQGVYRIEGYDNYNEFFVSSEASNIVVNEINYNSSSEFDPGDWIELYNNSDKTVDISGWIFQDNNNLHRYQISSATFLEPYKFLVLSSETSKFRVLFPEVSNVLGDIGFNINGSGELIRLYNNQGLLIDSLVFDNQAPWPLMANGTGSSLELTNPDLDNALAESWIASESYGSPGIINPSFDSIQNPHHHQFELSQNYPNPFLTTTTISYVLAEPMLTKIEVYNTTGRLVAIQSEAVRQIGLNQFRLSANNLPAGIYHYSLLLNGVRYKTKSMIKLHNN